MPVQNIIKSGMKIISAVVLSFAFIKHATAAIEPFAEWETFKSYSDCKLAIEIAENTRPLSIEIESFLEFNTSFSQYLDWKTTFVKRQHLHRRLYPDGFGNLKKHDYPISMEFGIRGILRSLYSFGGIGMVITAKKSGDKEKEIKALNNVRTVLQRVEKAHSNIEEKCNYKFKYTPMTIN